jgi:hypothetical protein
VVALVRLQAVPTSLYVPTRWLVGISPSNWRLTRKVGPELQFAANWLGEPQLAGLYERCTVFRITDKSRDPRDNLYHARAAVFVRPLDAGHPAFAKLEPNAA